jgi:hypothetical protein
VIGQLPRFALTPPVFRFRALAALAGRASLGGDRETLIACLQLGRLCAGLLPPYRLSPELVAERTEHTRQWLASVAVPSGIRSTAFGVFGGLTGHDRSRLSLAFEDLVKAAAGQLDEVSRVELNALVRELAGPLQTTRPHYSVTTFQPS